MNLAPGVIVAVRAGNDRRFFFRVVGCRHRTIPKSGHTSLREAERCSATILESRASPPKTEKTG